MEGVSGRGEGAGQNINTLAYRIGKKKTNFALLIDELIKIINVQQQKMSSSFKFLPVF